MHGQIAEHRWVLAVGAVFGFVGAFAAGNHPKQTKKRKLLLFAQCHFYV